MENYIKKGILIGVPLLAVLYFFFQPGKSDIFPPCIFYSATGLYCPGCGSQRAIHDLLHLNLQGVLTNNFLFIPAFLAIGYHYIHVPLNKRFNFKLPDIFYLKATPWVVLGIIILFWVLRNLPFLPFSTFAPG